MTEELVSYKLMPVWHLNDIPAGFRQKHNTKVGTWAQLTIFRGAIRFAMMDEDGNITEEFAFDAQNQPPLIHPQAWHTLLWASDDIECQMDFRCRPEDYFAKRHALSSTHSEVVEAARLIGPGRALDVGCGNGRNTLYLARKGFDVDAWDVAVERLANLDRIAAAEGLEAHIFVNEMDLDHLEPDAFDGPYDFILSTVVLMFLQPASVPPLVAAMQEQTAPGGYNLIVSAMDSDDHPCRVPFPFRFQAGQLKAMYEGWEIIKYNEDPGKLHRTDEHGNRIEMRFATLLARKPDA